MNPCDGCHNNKKCPLSDYKISCPCSKCIVKLKCINNCNNLTKFYRAHDIFGFDKETGIMITTYGIPIFKKNDAVKIKRKRS